MGWIIIRILTTNRSYTVIFYIEMNYFICFVIQNIFLKYIFSTTVGVDSSSCKRAGYKTHNAGHVCFKLYLLD